MTKDEVIMVEEAIRQMENEKYLHKRRDGSFHPHDVRNPDNQFHEWYLAKSDLNVEWKPEEMYDFCRRGKIVTKYTPLSFVNYPAYLNSLAYLHSGREHRTPEGYRGRACRPASARGTSLQTEQRV